MKKSSAHEIWYTGRGSDACAGGASTIEPGSAGRKEKMVVVLELESLFSDSVSECCSLLIREVKSSVSSEFDSLYLYRRDGDK